MLSQIVELRLLKGNRLATISLLFLELNCTLRRHLLASTRLLSTSHCPSKIHVLHQARSHFLHHVLLLGHRWLSLEFVVYSLNDSCKGRILIPALYGHSLVFNGYGIKELVCYRRHHVNLGRHLGELHRQSDLNVERCWRDRKL